VGLGVVVQSKPISQISLQVLDLLDVGNQGSVHGLLHLPGLGLPGSLGLFQLLLSLLSGLRSVLQLAGSVLFV
jgi:hypothetical protein